MDFLQRSHPLLTRLEETTKQKKVIGSLFWNHVGSELIVWWSCSQHISSEQRICVTLCKWRGLGWLGKQPDKSAGLGHNTTSLNSPVGTRSQNTSSSVFFHFKERERDRCTESTSGIKLRAAAVVPWSAWALPSPFHWQNGKSALQLRIKRLLRPLDRPQAGPKKSPAVAFLLHPQQRNVSGSKMCPVRLKIPFYYESTLVCMLEKLKERWARPAFLQPGWKDEGEYELPIKVNPT